MKKIKPEILSAVMQAANVRKKELKAGNTDAAAAADAEISRLMDLGTLTTLVRVYKAFAAINQAARPSHLDALVEAIADGGDQ